MCEEWFRNVNRREINSLQQHCADGPTPATAVQLFYL